MSPAASLTISPGTNSASGISRSVPPLTAVAVTRSIAFSSIGAGFLNESERDTKYHHHNHQTSADLIRSIFGGSERDDREDRQQNHERI
jgi:hypothetical protein